MTEHERLIDIANTIDDAAEDLSEIREMINHPIRKRMQNMGYITIENIINELTAYLLTQKER